MVNIFDDLQELNIPCYEEGNAPQELPDEYYTISEDYTSDNLAADNQTKQILYEFTIKYYTKDANTIYSGLLKALRTLKNKGYLTSGVGYYNNTYKNTWFSRQADIKKIEYIENMEEIFNETI